MLRLFTRSLSSLNRRNNFRFLRNPASNTVNSVTLVMSGTSQMLRRALSSIKPSLGHRNHINNRSSVGDSVRIRLFSLSSARNMKFVQFTTSEKPGEVRVGYVEGSNVVDLNKADSSLSTTLLGILMNGQLEAVNKVLSSKPPSVPLSSVSLSAPITGMDKVICIGLNYRDHCAEQKIQPPDVPMFFSKFSSTVTGPNEPVGLRSITKCVDWEAELTVVIGQRASNVKAKDAYDYIIGYTAAQDLSARDWQKQKNAGQFLLGKSMDNFCPIGPWVVTADEVGDPQRLAIKCSVNGVLKQSSNTEQLLHKIPDVIERLTSVMTLLPGDIILTGTPGGVGMYRDPPEYLKPGDKVETEIEKIGCLTTNIVRHEDDCIC